MFYAFGIRCILQVLTSDIPNGANADRLLRDLPASVKSVIKKDYEVCHELLPEMFKLKLCDCARKKNVKPKKVNCWLNSCIERKLIFEIMICSEMDKLSEKMNKTDKRKYTEFLECLFEAKKKLCEQTIPHYPCSTLC